MKIAIVGGGIVGSTAAFYISQSGNEVVLYDYDVGQATKAAAGIICPWFSKRRNKPWYRLANGGAHFYIQLLADLKRCGIESNAYQRKTTWLLKKKTSALDELIALAQTRKLEAPLINNIVKLTPKKQQQLLPFWHYGQDVIQFDGAAVVDGEQLCMDLQQAAQQNGSPIKNEKAVIEVISDKGVTINGQTFDAVILASGAWLTEILYPHGYHVDVRAQKGQLAVYKTDFDTGAWPLIMPEGEGDIIPHYDGTLFIGATHEDVKGFDLSMDVNAINLLLNSLQPYLPNFDFKQYDTIKIGSRAYTSDYSPFFGPLHDEKRIFVASGLGSSGLTTGPLIGYNLALMVLGEQPTLPCEDYSALKYVN